MKRILLVADVSNLYYTADKTFGGRKVDYETLYNRIKGDDELYRAIAYGSDMNNTAVHFKTALRNIGWEVKYKEPKVYPTPDPDKQIRKADWDVGIAMDVVQILDSVDVVVLATGDGDLVPCVQYVRSRGKLAHVIGINVSRDLRTAADFCTEIDESWLENRNRNGNGERESA